MKTCIKCGSNNFIKNGKYDRCKDCTENYYLLNRAKRLANKKAYREKNKLVIAVKKKEWDEKNKAYVLEEAKKYAKNNQIKRRVNEQNRRQMKKGGRLSSDIVEKLLILQKGMCPICRTKLVDKYHIDHIMPLALGGSHQDNNVQILCKKCNQQKHAKHPIIFMQSKGYLL